MTARGLLSPTVKVAWSGKSSTSLLFISTVKDGITFWICTLPDVLFEYGQELQQGTDPTNPDTDGDSVPNGTEVNSGTNPL